MSTTKRPNFLVIVADGYSDIGCYGSEIQTPNIDRIAKEGCLFTDCNHLAGVGVMSEMRGCEGERWNVRGHEGYLNHDVAALPEVLQAAGYHTLLSGKWHLGLKPENNPAARGFDKSFALLPGCTNHWGFEPQFEDPFSFFDRIPVLYSENGKRSVVQANTSNEYKDGFFSSEFYADNLIKYFTERTDAEKEKPFFAYLPFSAPHWPLQCSKADRLQYKGKYDEGPDVLRERRLASLRKLGLISESVKPHPMIEEDGCGVLTEEWEDLNEEERAKSARSMECFAGMVDNMDQNIGKVLDYLDQTGEADNTMVLFMSDNGAEGAAYESYPVMGKDLMAILGKYYNNSLDNIGNHDSFVWYGPRWAQAATAPSKLYKFYSTQGGIRVPMVCKYPPSWPKDQKVEAFSTVMDLMPTFLDMAGIKHPVPTGQRTGTFQGREVYGVKGKTWLPYLTGRASQSPSSSSTVLTSIYGEEEWVGWELFGRAALRKGHWKIVFLNAEDFGKGDWQLYDLSADPGETDDLSERYPQKLEELKKDWQAYVDETGTVWGAPVSGAAQNWSAMPEDSVGGDPIGQTRAWMRIGQGQRPALA